MTDQTPPDFAETAAKLQPVIYEHLQMLAGVCFTSAGPDGSAAFCRTLRHALAEIARETGIEPDVDAEALRHELTACRQELAVQVARANGAEADRDLALAQPGAVPEIQGRLRRIAEAQLRELDAEVRRLRALVPLEQRHARTTPTTDGDSRA